MSNMTIDPEDGCDVLVGLIEEISRLCITAHKEGDIARAMAYRGLINFAHKKVNVALEEKKERLAKKAIEEANIDNLGKF